MTKRAGVYAGALPAAPELAGGRRIDARQPGDLQRTGANTARVSGDFTLRGVTKPVTLEARCNCGYAGHPMNPHGRIGFSAHGTLKRSDFGIAYGIPAPGSTRGVGDEVTFAIEAELNGPPLAPAP